MFITSPTQSKIKELEIKENQQQNTENYTTKKKRKN